MTIERPTAQALRGRVAILRVRLYEMAPLVGLHPTRLGQALNERVAMSPELAGRIERALDEIEARAGR